MSCVFQVKYQLADHTVMFDEESSKLRWFLLPSEAAACIHGKPVNKFPLPFCPPNHREVLGLPPFVEHWVDEEICRSDMLENCLIETKQNVDDLEQQVTRNQVEPISAETKTKTVCETGVCVKENIHVIISTASGDRQCDSISTEKQGLSSKHAVAEDQSLPCCEQKIGNNACDIDKSRKRAVQNTEETQQDGSAKKVKEGKKKKEGLRWFSPPKTIFAPFLKVRNLF